MTFYADVSAPDGADGYNGTYVSAVSSDGAYLAGNYGPLAVPVEGFVETVATGVITNISDPNGSDGTHLTSISSNGAIVAGDFFISSGEEFGFVEDDQTGVYTTLANPEGSDGTSVEAISANGSIVAGSYAIGDDQVGFVETVATGVVTNISDPNGPDYTLVEVISGDGTTVGGNYVSGDGPVTGFVENLNTGVYATVGDPSGTGGSVVEAINNDGSVVAGYNADGGFVENVQTGVDTAVNDPKGAQSTEVKAISANGLIAAGTYTTSDNMSVGFEENITTGVFTDITDPNGANGTYVTSISADGSTVAGYYVNSSGADVGFFATDIACYARGTAILTDRGEVVVESLAVGDLVITASGALRPIRWVGHRRIDVSRHPYPAAVRPVQVLAGAFGEGLPRRDLWLSPGHNIACEGALMPISALINGMSVAQIEHDSVEYWHVELDAHDVLLAEGLPAESYLDTGNRAAFANGGGFVEAHPDFQPKHWAETCLPLIKEGPVVVRAKARLLARLAEQGYEVCQEGDAHIIADGLRVDPIWLSEAQLFFVLPAGGGEIALCSNLFVPAHTVADSTDARELGICVKRLEIDGETVALHDAACAAGWHEAEFVDVRFMHRWTSGSTPIPADARLVIIDLATVGRYWRATGNNVIAPRRFYA